MAPDPNDPQEAAARKLAHALDDEEGQLLIMMRLKNHRLDYSLVNRPDPTMSEITDAVLVAALVHAGSKFSITKRAKLKKEERQEALRGSETIAYKDCVLIDFVNKTIESTRNKGDTLACLSIVVQNLSANVAELQAKKPSPIGAN